MYPTCLHCDAPAASGRFCDHCGAPLEKPCPACRTANRVVARFCTHCGAGFAAPGTAAPPAGLPPRDRDAQYKHATILFADLCDSTGLIAAMDAEDASVSLGLALDMMAEAVARCGGTVAVRMGDGLMAMFGAPVAAEDHAVRACFAALAIIEGARDVGGRALPVRIGICSGPVILRPGRQDGDAEGMGVWGLTAHIASRIEHQAEPNTALLAQQTAVLVAGSAQLVPLGKVPLRGLAEPLGLYRLLGVANRSSWLVRSGSRALTTLVGRQQELALLGQALRRAAGGGEQAAAQAVALVADAGMGKSRLVHDFLGAPVLAGWRVMRVETTVHSLAVPYLLVTALLREIVGCAPGDPVAEIAARLPARLAALMPDAAIDGAPLLRYLDSDAGGPDLDPTDPSQRRRQLLAALVGVLRRQAARQPLVIVIEDYHWLDASSVELVEELLDGLQRHPVLLLLTTRPERRPGWSADPAAPRAEIELWTLSDDQAEAMLCELIGPGAALAPLRAQIVARAGGTPFFLEEFARALHETGVLAEGAPPPADLEIPGSVQAIVASRIDRLLPVHRRILQVAAVVGRQFAPALLGAILDVPAAVLARGIEVLGIGGFLAELGLPTGPRYRFSHVLIQAMAHDSLLRSDRRGLHARILRVLETTPDEASIEDLARHAIAAEAWPEAVRYSMEAGERATRRSAWTEARVHLEAVLAALQKQPVTAERVGLGIDVRLRLRFVLGAANDLARVQDYLHEADVLAGQAGDALTLARVYINRSTALAHGGDLARAKELSRQALDIMLAAVDPVGIVSAAFGLGQAMWYAGDLAEGLRVLEQTLPHARSEAGQRRSAATFVLPAVVHFCFLAQFRGETGAVDAGFLAIEEARGIAGRHGQAFDRLLVSMYEGDLLLQDGRVTASIDLLERALRGARADGLDYHVPYMAYVLGRAYVRAGRFTDAADLLLAGCERADRNGHRGKRLLCNPALARAMAEGPQRDIIGACDLARRTTEEAAALGFRPTQVQAQLALARALVLAGQASEAAAQLRAAAILAARIGLRAAEAEALEWLARLLRVPPPASAAAAVWSPPAVGPEPTLH
ncbi:adenylate/guanylate cyclase domain-containing protein [Dankookia rubra]|uniref:Adenylate/guanylate cyclase domain-containing protein n=1 Tax=Dankookia rubra TaxID=1442381 RepID=A0A4R5QEL6_9PROT|nr:adenylate/guanylate cyclase domain-containing protein [Dankookia rubra]TDH61426.1 adenylate/guanylate cyclase domain-containing protein [Dankookia rubra]